MTADQPGVPGAWVMTVTAGAGRAAMAIIDITTAAL